MALSDLTFKLYEDSNLTIVFSGISQFVHETDLSDNPQDIQLFFGSTEASRTVEATSNPGVDQITLTPTDTLDDWTTLTAYALGDYIEPSTPNGLKYECTTAGTSDVGEPTFPTVGIGSTVADATVVWTLLGARHETTEIKLALTAGGLPGATGGASLDLGATITSGIGNAVEVNMRITNAVTTVNNNTGQAEIAVFVNEIVET